MTAAKFYADDFQELSMEMGSSLGNQGEKVGHLLLGMRELANSKSIKGNGADAMRAYISEVHISLLSGLINAFEGFQTAIGTYWMGYEGQDGDGNFRFVKEDFEAHERELSQAKATLEGYRSRLSAAAASASSLVGVGTAGAQALMMAEDALERMGNLARGTKETWDSYERGHHGFDQVEELLSRIGDQVRRYQNGANVSKGRGYVPGSFFSSAGDFLAAYEAVDAFNRQNMKASAKAWEHLQKDFQADVKRARKESEKKVREEGLWGLLSDALQVVGGAVIAAIGLGLTPLTGGLSLGLTAMGAMFIAGGINSGINHASMAVRGKGCSLLGNFTEDVGKWYNKNLVKPAMKSGNLWLEALAGAGAEVGELAAGMGQISLYDMGKSVGSLANPKVRAQFGKEIGNWWNQIRSGNAYVAGKTAVLVGSLFIGGEGTIGKAGDATSLVTKLGGVRIGTAGEAASLVDNMAGKLEDMQRLSGEYRVAYVTAGEGKSVLEVIGREGKMVPTKVQENFNRITREAKGASGAKGQYSGEEWCRYFRETYGANNVIWENATPSQLARSWQGTGKYIGVDEYVDTTIQKGTVLYRGEPNGTEYFTTMDAIEQSGRDATNVFEGLQVEKNPIHGYRGEMQGYVFNEEVASAYGITNANPQFGKGGLPQYFVPNVDEYIQKGILVKVDSITLRK